MKFVIKAINITIFLWLDISLNRVRFYNTGYPWFQTFHIIFFSLLLQTRLRIHPNRIHLLHNLSKGLNRSAYLFPTKPKKLYINQLITILWSFVITIKNFYRKNKSTLSNTGQCSRQRLYHVISCNASWSFPWRNSIFVSIKSKKTNK